MKHILLLWANGTFTETQINGSVKEIKNYYENATYEDSKEKVHKLLKVLFNVESEEYFKYIESVYEDDSNLKYCKVDKDFYSEIGTLPTGEQYVRINVTLFKIFGFIVAAKIERHEQPTTYFISHD
jgi:hypothetical protein